MRFIPILQIIIVLTLSLGYCVMADSNNETASQDMNAALEGSDLTSTAATELEKQLAQNPADVTTRIKLLGFYMMEQYSSPDAARKRIEHVFWMIENEPDRDITGRPYCDLDTHVDPESFAEGKALWMKQVERFPKNAVVIGNAASYLNLDDHDAAEELLQQAKTIDPRNPQWPQELGHLYDLQTNMTEGNTKTSLAGKALAEFESAFVLTTDKDEKSYLLNSLAVAAYEAGDLQKANDYANQALTAAEQGPRDWNYGNAIHKGNLILGLCSLQQGNIAAAKEHLLAAGKTPGSPQLDSFGPNMTLAKQLLERNERDVVLEYFQLCGMFWQTDADELGQWTKAVQGGGIPDFGANLDY